MNRPTTPRYWPLAELVRARLLEFVREREALFWVYGFPILMTMALGIAFRNQPVESVTVDIVAGPGAETAAEALSDAERFEASILDPDECRRRLRTSDTDLVVIPQTPSDDDPAPHYELLFDPSRPQSALARNAVDDALQRAAGRKDVATVEDRIFDETGGRYVDFLVPGLLGMSLMGSGLWGVGFVTVDMRIRKLLKRLVATPMKKTHFLAGLMLSRLTFMIPEVLILLVFARYAFGVVIHGSLLALTFLILLGAGTFAGIGLLVASRAKTLEAVNGLMNLAMLPMWIFSGIFFSSDRFPDVAQPFIKALPLTPLLDALRAVMLEGTPLIALWPQVAILLAWGGITFALALRLFRWS